jgi:hypothetical protein
MAEQLIWNVTVTATGGPQLTHSGVVEVEAYDKINIQVPAGGDRVVDLGPGSAGRISCLAIVPTEPSATLTYKVGTDTIKLDAPQFLVRGAVDLTKNPASLKIANAGPSDAAVEILIGRDATP